MRSTVAVSASARSPYKHPGSGDPVHRSKRSKDTQLIDVSYYQPQDIPRSQTPTKLGPSFTRAASPSSSEYSCDSDVGPPPRSTTKTLKHARRSSTLSDAGTDRRRLAIMQMETIAEGRPKPVSEHGHNPRSGAVPAPNLAGLAIVAPPDASPTSYTHLSPPTSATKVDHTRTRKEPKLVNMNASQGLSSQPSEPVGSLNGPSTDKSQGGEQHSSPSFPSIQPLNIRTNASSSSINLHSPAVDQPITTPPIGQTKDIYTPVAGPVVVSLEPSQPSNSSRNSNNSSAHLTTMQSLSDSPSKRNGISYLQYQPGLHATAGPLPPPPRATFAIDPCAPPPPRPPRMQTPNPRSRGDIEAVRHALQLPPSVSAVLASRSSASPESVSSRSSPNSNSGSSKLSSVESSTSIEEELEVKPSHRREGAFIRTPDLASSQISTSSSLSSKDKDETTETIEKKASENIQANDQLLPRPPEQVVIVTPPPRHDSLHTQDNAPNRERTPSPVLVERPSSPESVPGPSPPPKSFRNSLTSGLKRFSSISRTSSASSRSPKRSSIGTVYSSRTPSPPYPCQQDLATPKRRKITTQNPAALFCHEVYTIKSSSERCSIYIQKINDLHNCDTGLIDWLNDAKYRGSNSNTALSNMPSSPSTDPFTPQRRHTSGSSMMTEATFPRRPDATTATDLTHSHRNITPPTALPPLLPYPSLAKAQQQQRPPHFSSNVGSSTPFISIRSFAPLTPSSALKGGFFSSLGRRSSISGRREKPGITALSPSNSQNGSGLAKDPPPSHQLQQAQHSPAPRPVNVMASPSVPGGPRAPPHRVKRSQTLMTTPAPFSTRPPVAAEHKEQLARRPSTHNLLLDHHLLLQLQPQQQQQQQQPVVDVRPDPEFTRQVDRLADLLPHADRNILAAYLRRSGQDILAIGQYLEDEKNGTLHTD